MRELSVLENLIAERPTPPSKTKGLLAKPFFGTGLMFYGWQEALISSAFLRRRVAREFLLRQGKAVLPRCLNAWQLSAIPEFIYPALPIIAKKRS
jgi:hypothetical protein